MVLDPDGCFRALRARDARFDGVFFAAIKTTGIYCRPICPARAARRDSCLFFETAAAAERSGFRPCLRCRPEIAPGNARVDAMNRIATAALARIEAGALNERSVDELAAEFGVTSRHLRRAVESEFGVTPVEFAQTQRLLLAKQLLTETAMPATEVAYASGFASLRRFNALFQQRYRLSPTQLRGRRTVETSETVACEIAYRPPHDWLSLLGFFAERACPGVEEVTGATYRRYIIAGQKRGWIEVSQSTHRHSLRVAIDSQLTPVLAVLLARVKRMFDVSAHPRRVEEHLREDERLRPLVDAHPGLRVPGAFDGFEMALRAVLGQQVSVKAARTIAGRFAAAFDGLCSAERIAGASVEDLRKLGVTVGRAESILALARKTAGGTLRLEPGADSARTMRQLKEIPGIGEWTAQYIAMRALGWPDALPHTDLGLYKALDTRSPREVLRMSARWSPWRSYALMHLWKSLEGK